MNYESLVPIGIGALILVRAVNGYKNYRSRKLEEYHDIFGIYPDPYKTLRDIKRSIKQYKKTGN